MGPVGTRNGYYIHKQTTLAEVLSKHPCHENVPETLILSLVVIKEHRNQNKNNVRHKEFLCKAPLYTSHMHAVQMSENKWASTVQLYSNGTHKDPNCLQILI